MASLMAIRPGTAKEPLRIPLRTKAPQSQSPSGFPPQTQMQKSHCWIFHLLQDCPTNVSINKYALKTREEPKTGRPSSPPWRRGRPYRLPSDEPCELLLGACKKPSGSPTPGPTRNASGRSVRPGRYIAHKYRHRYGEVCEKDRAAAS